MKGWMAGWPTLDVDWADGEQSRHAIFFRWPGDKRIESTIRAFDCNLDAAVDSLVAQFGGYSIYHRTGYRRPVSAVETNLY